MSSKPTTSIASVLSGRRAPLLRDSLIAVAFATLGFFARTVRWEQILTPRGVLFWDGDGYYHMWRIAYSIQHFPAYLDFDPFVNFPTGGTSPWPPGFDWTVAGLLRLIAGADDLAAAERLAAFLPVALGCISVVLLMGIARRFEGGVAAIFTGLLAALLPACIAYTQIGFLDHHAAITLLGTLLLGGAMYVSAFDESGGWGWPWLAGGLVAATLFVWPGALLHVLLLEGALLVWMLVGLDRSVASGRAIKLAMAHAFATLLIAPYSMGRSFGEYGDFTPLALTSFQPVYFGSAALSLAILSLFWRRAPLADGIGGRLAIATLLGGIGLGAAFALLPGLSDTLDRSAGWFTGSEGFHARISELRPFMGRDGSNWRNPLRMLSALFFLFPFAWLVLIRPAQASSARGPRWILAAWSLAFGLATLTQFRFVNTFGAAFALVWGCVAGEAYRAIVRSRAAAPRLAAVQAGALILVAILCLSPIASFFLDQREDATGRVQRAAKVRAVARFIEEVAPPLPGPGEVPSYGVLNAWSLGHAVRYYSRRPVVQDNFGPYVARENVEAATAYYAAESEEEGIAILERLGVRYVVITAGGTGTDTAYAPASLTRRMLSEGRGSASKGPPGPIRFGARALKQHRLLYESEGGAPPVRLFERVRGATIEGTAEPGQRVQAELRLRGRRFEFLYRSGAIADETGSYAIRVPYPTEAFSPGLIAVGSYRVRSGRAQEPLKVTESEIREGARVEGPNFAGLPTES